MKTRTTMGLLWMLLVLPACGSGGAGSNLEDGQPGEEITELALLEPARGAMFGQDQVVGLVIESPDDGALLNGEPLEGSGRIEVSVPSVDGLGFLQLEHPDDELVKVRSFLQGSLADPGASIAQSVQMSLGPSMISSSFYGDTLERVVELVLARSEFTPFVDNPIKVKQSVMSTTFEVDIMLADLRAESPEASLELEGDGLRFDLELTPLRADYVLTGEGPKLEGQVALDRVGVSGALRFVGGEPVASAVQVEEIGVEEDRLLLSGALRLRAQSPMLAGEDDGVLLRAPIQAMDPMPGGNLMSLYVGARFINHLLFAIWDAGNLSAMSYSLFQLGLKGLPYQEPPYDRFEQAQVSLLLPPLLYLDQRGAWLDLGGLLLELEVPEEETIRAWSSLRLPIKLKVSGNSPAVLVFDNRRSIERRAIEFDRVSAYTEDDRMGELMEVSARAIVEDVLGENLPLGLQSVRVLGLQGQPVLDLSSVVVLGSRLPDGWLLESVMRIEELD